MSARRLLKRVRAVEQIKEAGDMSFWAGEAGQAVREYGEALELVGQSEGEAGGGYMRAALLGKRAIAQLELEQLELALEDANAALVLNPSSYEVFRTRAHIHIEMDCPEDAVQDFKAAHEHAKRNGATQGILYALVKAIEKTEVMLERSQKNCYKILSLSRDCTDAEIKVAFKRESLTHHPDRGGDEEKFKMISEAYAVLSNPRERLRHDRWVYQGSRINPAIMGSTMDAPLAFTETPMWTRKGQTRYGRPGRFLDRDELRSGGLGRHRREYSHGF